MDLPPDHLPGLGRALGARRDPVGPDLPELRTQRVVVVARRLHLEAVEDEGVQERPVLLAERFRQVEILRGHEDRAPSVEAPPCRALDEEVRPAHRVERAGKVAGLLTRDLDPLAQRVLDQCVDDRRGQVVPLV